MPIFTVEVEVALSRPPKIDKTFFITVSADNGNEAEVIAIQIAYATRGVVMPVASVVTSWDD